MTQTEVAWRLRIHLTHSGVIDTVVTYEEVQHNDATDIEELVERYLNPSGKPQWITLGSVKFHPQAISAIEIEEL